MGTSGYSGMTSADLISNAKILNEDFNYVKADEGIILVAKSLSFQVDGSAKMNVLPTNPTPSQKNLNPSKRRYYVEFCRN